MFESIKSALTKNSENGSSKLKDYIRTEAGNTYTVRLLPNVKDPSKTFFHYYNYGWNSFANGKLITAVSPTTWNQRDPIAEERYRILRNGTEEEKKKAAAIVRRENWLVNVYVVNDPVNSENNNKVKILRFGRQLHKIIMDAIEGEEASELGPRIFDLSPKGCNLKIKVEKQGDYPTYVSSKFTTPKEIEGLDEDNYKATYGSAFDLESYVNVKSYDELKELLDTHYHTTRDLDEETATDNKPVTQKTSAPVPVVEVKANKTKSTVEEDESINELLKDL
ncbi:hypothetical protein EBR43_10870 [bacterium]|nr:hypothetical protein [bacterium]